MMNIRVDWNTEGLNTINQRFKLMPGAAAMLVEAIAVYGESRMKAYATLRGEYRNMLQAWMVSPFTWEVGATGKAKDYAHYLNYGTDSSRGRYIKKFGKRFSKAYLEANPIGSIPPGFHSAEHFDKWVGRHPGNKAVVGQQGLQFYEKAIDDMEANAERIGTRIVQNLLDTGNLG